MNIHCPHCQAVIEADQLKSLWGRFRLAVRNNRGAGGGGNGKNSPLSNIQCPHCQSVLEADELKSLWGRFCSRLRKTRKGGANRVWKNHNPMTVRCRCQKCNDRRTAARAATPANVHP